jgi:hypothetical protein
LFSSLNGQLFPAKDPTPTFTACGAALKPDQYMVTTGTSAVHVFTKFPHTVLIWKSQTDNIALLRIDRVKDGRIRLLAEIRNVAGRIIVEGAQNGFYVNPRAALFARRPDKSSLRVEDEFGKEVLFVRYANRQVIRMHVDFSSLGLPFPFLDAMSTCGDLKADIYIDSPVYVTPQK